MLVEQILSRKGRAVATVPPSTTVRAVIAELRDRNVGALLVRTDNGHLAGIVSERDVVRALADLDDALDATVTDIMSTELATCDPATTAEQLMVLMTERRIRHVPVLDGGEVVGIVSIGDVVKTRVGELESEARQLVDYIRTGR